MINSYIELKKGKKIFQQSRAAKSQIYRPGKHTQAVMENMLDCFAIFTAHRGKSDKIENFKVENMNTLACREQKISKLNLIGKGINEILPSYLGSGLFDEYCGVVETGRQFKKEVIVYNGDNHSRAITSAYTVKASRLGDGFALSWREITDIKRAEQTLNLYTHIISHFKEQMSYIDNHGIFAEVNDEFLKAFNRKRDGILGHSIEEVFNKNILEDVFKRNYKRCLCGEEVVFEQLFKFPGDGLRYTEITMYPVMGINGEISGVIMNLNDISEKIELQKQILNIGQQERRKLGMILHDGISHKLLSIAIKSKVLFEELKEKSLEEAGEAFEIEESINKTIEEVRRLARGLYPMSLDKLGLFAMCEELIDSLKETCNISCVMNVDKSIEINNMVTATHIYYIIQEAVTNIIKHSNAKNVAISMVSDHKIITLAIKDDGIGMSREGDSENGMGISIMRYRIRMIGGSFNIKRARGGGTEIICKFKQDG